MASPAPRRPANDAKLDELLKRIEKRPSGGSDRDDFTGMLAPIHGALLGSVASELALMEFVGLVRPVAFSEGEMVLTQRSSGQWCHASVFRYEDKPGGGLVTLRVDFEQRKKLDLSDRRHLSRVRVARARIAGPFAIPAEQVGAVSPPSSPSPRKKTPSSGTPHRESIVSAAQQHQRRPRQQQPAHGYAAVSINDDDEEEEEEGGGELRRNTHSSSRRVPNEADKAREGSKSLLKKRQRSQKRNDDEDDEDDDDNESDDAPLPPPVTAEAAGLSLLVITVYYLVGIWYYHWHGDEHWDISTTFYFTSISITTVGYGDVVPKSDRDKVITCTSSRAHNH